MVRGRPAVPAGRPAGAPPRRGWGPRTRFAAGPAVHKKAAPGRCLCSEGTPPQIVPCGRGGGREAVVGGGSAPAAARGSGGGGGTCVWWRTRPAAARGAPRQATTAGSTVGRCSAARVSISRPAPVQPGAILCMVVNHARLAHHTRLRLCSTQRQAGGQAAGSDTGFSEGHACQGVLCLQCPHGHKRGPAAGQQVQGSAGGPHQLGPPVPSGSTIVTSTRAVYVPAGAGGHSCERGQPAPVVGARQGAAGGASSNSTALAGASSAPCSPPLGSPLTVDRRVSRTLPAKVAPPLDAGPLPHQISKRVGAAAGQAGAGRGRPRAG